MTDAIDKIFDRFDNTEEGDNKSPSSKIDDIFNRFDESQTAAPLSQSKSTAPIPGSDTAADYARTKEFQNRSKAKEFLSDIGETYKRKTGENFEAGREAASTALGDIGSNLPASGIGKSVMGTAGMAASPLTGAYDTAGDIFGRLTGNSEAGSRAAALPFGGLPIAKGAQSVKVLCPQVRP